MAANPALGAIFWPWVMSAYQPGRKNRSCLDPGGSCFPPAALDDAIPDCRADEGFRQLQDALMQNPEAGDVIEGTGGLRKIRHADPRQGKGKRGGMRVIDFWWKAGRQFWLFTLYDKDEMGDLTPQARKALRGMLKRELEARA